MRGASIACGYAEFDTRKKQYIDLPGFGSVISKLTSFSIMTFIKYRSYADWARSVSLCVS